MKTNPRHEKFIEEMIQHGDRARAYKAAYPNIAKYSRSAAHRLANNAYIKQRIEEGRIALQREVQEKLVEEHYANLLAIAKKRVLLGKVINGEILFEKTFKTKDGIETKHLPATLTEIFRAIELDNKLAKELPQPPEEEIEYEISIGDELFK
jgi:hypothetical protein